MYNKRQYKKYNDKKVLHKVKKQWMTISVAVLGLLGGGAVATHVSANASTVNNNSSNNNYSVNVNQQKKGQPTLQTNDQSNHDSQYTLSAHNNSQNQTVGNTAADANQNNSQSSHTISSQASDLYSHIINHGIMTNMTNPSIHTPNSNSDNNNNHVMNYPNTTPVKGVSNENNGLIKSLKATKSYNNSNLKINYYTIRDNTSNSYMDDHDLAELSAIDPSKDITFNPEMMPNLPFDRNRSDWDFSVNPANTVVLNSSDENNAFSSRLNSVWNRFKNIDLSHVDTSNVSDMSGMFADDDQLKSLAISSFDTSNVKNMSNMFQNDSGLSGLHVGSWDTSNVKNMSNMFQNDSGLTSLDPSSWDTSNVSDMSGMFSGLTSLSSLGVDNFDTSHVSNMSNMFKDDPQLTALNLNNFDTTNIENMQGMFYGDKALGQLSLGEQFVMPGNLDSQNPNIKAESSIFSDNSDLNKLSVSASTDLNINNQNGKPGSPFFTGLIVNSDGDDVSNTFNNNGQKLMRGIYYKAVNANVDLYNVDRNNIDVNDQYNFNINKSGASNKLLNNSQSLLIPTNPDNEYHPGGGDINSQITVNDGYSLIPHSNNEYVAQPQGKNGYVITADAKGNPIDTSIDVDATFAAPEGVTKFSQEPNENSFSSNGISHVDPSSENHRIIIQKEIPIPFSAHVGDYVTVNPLDYNEQGYRVATSDEVKDLNQAQISDSYARRYIGGDIDHIGTNLEHAVQGSNTDNPESFDVTDNLSNSSYPFDFIYTAKPASIDINYINQHGAQVDPVPMHINGYTDYRFTIGQFPTPAGYRINDNTAVTVNNKDNLTYITPNHNLMDDRDSIDFPGQEGYENQTENFLPDQTLMMTPNSQTNQYRNLNERGEINVNVEGNQENRLVNVPIYYDDGTTKSAGVYISGHVGDLVSLTPQMVAAPSGYVMKPSGSVMINANSDTPFGGINFHKVGQSNPNKKVTPISAPAQINQSSAAMMIRNDYIDTQRDDEAEYNTINSGITIYNEIQSAYVNIHNGKANNVSLQSLVQDNDQLNVIDSSASQDYAKASSEATSLRATLPNNSMNNNTSNYSGPFINEASEVMDPGVEATLAYKSSVPTESDLTSDENKFQRYSSLATSENNLAQSTNNELNSTNDVNSMSSIANTAHHEMNDAKSYANLKASEDSLIESLSSQSLSSGSNPSSTSASQSPSNLISNNDYLSNVNNSLGSFNGILSSVIARANSINTNDSNTKQIQSMAMNLLNHSELQSLENVYGNDENAIKSLSGTETSDSNTASQAHSALMSLNNTPNQNNNSLNALRNQANLSMAAAAEDAETIQKDKKTVNSLSNEFNNQISLASNDANQAELLLKNVKSPNLVTAKPITVIFTNQNNNSFVKQVNGNLNQSGDDITKLCSLPLGYYLNAGQNTYYKFINQPQTMNLRITGNQVSGNVTVTINRQSSTGLNLGSVTRTVPVSGLVGNTYSINPLTYKPSGYHVTNGDQDITGQFTPAGISNSNVNYTYAQDQTVPSSANNTPTPNTPSSGNNYPGGSATPNTPSSSSDDSGGSATPASDNTPEEPTHKSGEHSGKTVDHYGSTGVPSGSRDTNYPNGMSNINYSDKSGDSLGEGSNNSTNELPQTGESQESYTIGALLTTLGGGLSALGYAMDRKRRYNH